MVTATSLRVLTEAELKAVVGGKAGAPQPKLPRPHPKGGCNCGGPRTIS